MVKKYRNIESDILASLTLTQRSAEFLMLVNIINFSLTLAAKIKTLIVNRKY